MIDGVCGLSDPIRDQQFVESRKKEIESKEQSVLPLSPELRLNELHLGMTRHQVYETRSLIDGRLLGGTHQARRDSRVEMVGHIADGINAASRVQFSDDDILEGIEGCNLFFQGQAILPSKDGTLDELGVPSSSGLNSDGVREFSYHDYSLVYYLDERGSAFFKLGRLDM